MSELLDRESPLLQRGEDVNDQFSWTTWASLRGVKPLDWRS